MDKITIYTSETCPYCKAVKEKLKEKEIEFNERLNKDWPDKWQEIVNLTGMPKVPTVSLDGTCLVPGRDFRNEDHLINIIQNYAPSHYSAAEINLEKIKTLNYNMGQAFARMDQLLKEIENKLNIKENDK